MANKDDSTSISHDPVNNLLDAQPDEVDRRDMRGQDIASLSDLDEMYEGEDS